MIQKRLRPNRNLRLNVLVVTGWNKTYLVLFLQFPNSSFSIALLDLGLKQQTSQIDKLPIEDHGEGQE